MSICSRRLSYVLFILCVGMPVPGARAQTLIQNPGFDAGLNLWTVAPSAFATVSWDVTQGNAALGAVSVDVPATGSPVDLFVVSQCVPAKGGTTYDVGGSFRYPSSVGAPPVGSVLVQNYSDTGCTASCPAPPTSACRRSRARPTPGGRSPTREASRPR